MQAPWDGIWTEELLRDLCGGVTRKEGSFKAVGQSLNRKYLTNPLSPPFKVERKDGRSYRVVGSGLDGDGDYMKIEEAVKRLARLQAVPVNEDGTVWKIKPGELPPGVCPECEGAGEFECDECEGKGSRECDMGHNHDCDDCGAIGSIKCGDCGGTGSTANLKTAAKAA